MTGLAIWFSRPRRYLAALLFLAYASTAGAQEPDQQVEPPPQTNDQQSEASNIPESPATSQPGLFRRFFRDEYQMWTSPFRPRNYGSPTWKRYGIPFLLLSGGLIASDRESVHILPNTVDQIRWSGRVSQMGASYTVAAFSGATYLVGKAIRNEHASRTGLMGLEAYAHTQLVVLGIKAMTGRERPIENNQDGSFWKGGNSFPSGHSATSFALATVFAYEYRKHIAVPIAAYSVATLITVSRTTARRHWPSDVVIGASLGFLIGRFVYRNHHDPAVPGSPAGSTSRLVPAVGYSSGAAILTWSY